MTEKIDMDDLELSDSELIEVLKNHGMDRRTLMKVIGVGAGAAMLGGTASGSPGKGTRIDKIYGAPYAAGEDTVPSGLVDHTVELHVHKDGDGEHVGFPVPDDAAGPRPDPDDFDDYPEFHFEPVGLHVKPGEIVEFKTKHGLHTITSFKPKFSEPPFLVVPDRVPTDYGFTSPIVAKGDSWLYKFTEKGVYDILCLPHLFLGMVIRIVVFDPEEDKIDDTMFNEPTGGPLPPNANRVLSDKLLDPKNIAVDDSDGRVEWSELSLDGPPSVPRPTVELSVSEGGSSSSDAEFEADWSVNDPNGDLDTVRLTLTDNTDGGTEDLYCDVISGGSASGPTTTLVASGDEGSGNEYTVELVVTDASGLTTTATADVMES